MTCSPSRRTCWRIIGSARLCSIRASVIRCRWTLTVHRMRAARSSRRPSSSCRNQRSIRRCLAGALARAVPCARQPVARTLSAIPQAVARKPGDTMRSTHVARAVTRAAMKCLRAVTLILAGALLPAAGSTQEHAAVDIGGRRLDVLRVGTGAPAVVFEVGLADSLDTWAPVCTNVGELTTAIAYSRAGFGRSDSSPDGYSARHAVDERQRWRRRLPVPPPYLLVGRSDGGRLVRLYTSVYASADAGLVLVERTHEQQVRRYAQLGSSYPAAFLASFHPV